MRSSVYILYFFVNLFLCVDNAIAQKENSLIHLIINDNKRDSTERVVKQLKIDEKELLFNELQNILLSDTIDKNKIGYILCYFRLHPAKNSIKFLLNNIAIGSIINQAISSCSSFDVLVDIGKPAHKISKEHILYSKNYFEFHTIISVISITGNWSKKREKRFIKGLKNENVIIKEYCDKWLNGDMK